MRPPRPDDLSVGGLTDAGKQLKAIADSLSRIASGQQRLSVSGPGARFAAAQRNMFLARAVGDPLQQRDAAMAMQRAQAGFGGGGFSSRLSTFVRSTRFGAGGFSPLVGRGLDLVGAGGAAGGPVALAATVAAAALKALADATAATVAHMQELGDAARVSGGTPGQIAALTAMGIPAGEIGGRVGATRERITHDPFARMAAAGLGVQAQPGPFGEVNQAEDYRKLLEGLRGIHNTTERLRQARMLGMEADLKYIDVSQSTIKLQGEIAAGMQGIFNAENARAANDLAANMESLHLAALNAGGALTKDLIGPLNEFIRINASGLARLSQSGAPAAVGRAAPFVFGGLAGGAFFEWLRHSMKQNADAQKEATQATKENTYAMRAMKEGMFGGGEWARSAIGAGMQGEFLRQGLLGNSLRMGAFRL